MATKMYWTFCLVFAKGQEFLSFALTSTGYADEKITSFPLKKTTPPYWGNWSMKGETFNLYPEIISN